MGETSLFICVFYYPAASITLQSSQPLPHILHLSYPRVSILPQVEEFFVMLDGFGVIIYKPPLRKYHEWSEFS
jgi:hypothetical protein